MTRFHHQIFAATQGAARGSGQCRERRGLEGQQLVVAASCTLRGQAGSTKQRAADRDQIELVALQPDEQVVDPSALGRFAVQRADEVAGQGDAADGDGGFAREPLSLTPRAEARSFCVIPASVRAARS
jgi:hypothetical protein